MIHDILSESVRKEIDSIRSKFPHDKNRSSIIESLLIIQHENSGYLNEDLIGADGQAVVIFNVLGLFYAAHLCN